MRNGGTIEVALGGSRAWKSSRIVLFIDCEPGHGAPVAMAQERALAWKLVVGGLDQGQHRLSARVTVSDGEREFSDTSVLVFQRSGTTLNLGAMFIIGGIATAAVGATSIAARRRPDP